MVPAMPKYRFQNGRLNLAPSLTHLEDRTTPTLCCGDFTTFTQGGWGAVPNGNNPGTYLHANFAAAFPNGAQIGDQSGGAAASNNTAGNWAAYFSSASVITLWLPHTGPSGALGGDTVDPVGEPDNDDGTLAGQTLTLTLNLGFDDYDPAFSPSTTDMSSLIVTSGAFAGKTAQFVLDTCNAILAGVTTTGYTATQANEAATAINENFDNGSVNGGTDNGFLDCADDCDNDTFTTVTIEGYKYNDRNGDGDDEGGTDPGISGWHVSIWLDSNGNGAEDTGETHDVVTGANGFFSYTEDVLDSVLAGAGAVYSVNEVQQSGWTQTGGIGGYDGVLSFDTGTAASDLAFGNFQNITIGGVKFYDSDTDGVRDNNEPNISGWQVGIDVNGDDVADYFTTTGADGSYVFGDLDNADGDNNPLTGSDLGPNATFVIIEGTQPNWVATTPTSVSISVGGSGVQSGGVGTADFGNVKLGTTGGKTLGFWSNKNGQAIFNGYANALPGLTALNLRNASGGNFDPGNYAAFRTWILNATATNMSYMLSAQFAASWLNVNALGISADMMIHVDTLAQWSGNTQGVALATNLGSLVSPTGFVRLGDVMTVANTLLGTNGSILAGNPLRTYAEALKVVLDGFNNNLSIAVVGLGAWHDDDHDGVMDPGEGIW